MNERIAPVRDAAEISILDENNFNCQNDVKKSDRRKSTSLFWYAL